MVHITAITFIAAIVNGAPGCGFSSITVPFAPGIASVLRLPGLVEGREVFTWLLRHLFARQRTLQVPLTMFPVH